MGGGAWPFLVGGAIWLVNSGNERDSSLLNRRRHLGVRARARARADSIGVVCVCVGRNSLATFKNSS